MKRLLTVTTIIEGVTGLGFLIAPTVISRLLLGTALDAPAGLTVARVAGAALLVLGIACWLVRERGRALIAAMLIYNVLAAAIFAHAAVGLSLSGIGLWPATALHTAMAAWCAVVLKSNHATKQADEL